MGQQQFGEEKRKKREDNKVNRISGRMTIKER
jgi:hypothetical protein